MALIHLSFYLLGLQDTFRNTRGTSGGGQVCCEWLDVSTTVAAGPLGVHVVPFYPSVGFSGAQPRRVEASDVFRLCSGPKMLSGYFISARGLTEWWKEGKRKLNTSGGSTEDTALSLTMPHLLKRHALAEKQRGALALIDLEQMLTQRLFAIKRSHLSQWIQIRLICFFFLPMPKSSNDVFQPSVALLRLIKVRIFTRRTLFIMMLTAEAPVSEQGGTLTRILFERAWFWAQSTRTVSQVQVQIKKLTFTPPAPPRPRVKQGLRNAPVSAFLFSPAGL